MASAIAGWIQGVAIVPTPAKEYILRSELGWNKEIWIALGGVAGTTAAALAAAVYVWCKPSPDSEAVQAAAFLPLGAYSLRFLLIGRGHDAVEWQAAQTALGLLPAGHAIDVFFLCLLIAGFVVWVIRLNRPLRSWLKLPMLALAGIILLILLQVGNNALFDRVFPVVKVVDIPEGLSPR